MCCLHGQRNCILLVIMECVGGNNGDNAISNNSGNVFSLCSRVRFLTMYGYLTCDTRCKKRSLLSDFTGHSVQLAAAL